MRALKLNVAIERTNFVADVGILLELPFASAIFHLIKSADYRDRQACQHDHARVCNILGGVKEGG